MNRTDRAKLEQAQAVALGRAIALAVAVTCVLAGLVIAFTTPPLSGGTIAAGALLVLAGFLAYPSVRKGR